MVEVGLAAPDARTGQQRRVEFVVPAAVGAVDEVTGDEVPEAAVPVFVLGFTGTSQQRRGSGTGLGMHPVQALAHHRAVVPVQGVDQPRRAICLPGVATGAVEQAPGGGQQGLGRRQLRPLQGRLQVQYQACPFEGVAGRGPVRTEAIGGVFAVVVGERLPLRIEMFRDTHAVGSGAGQDQALDDPLGAQQPLRVAGHVGQGEEGFDAVHVAVGAPVGLRVQPVAGERLAQGALLFAPEALLDDLGHRLQQRRRLADARHHRRAGGEGDEGVQVGGLAGVAMTFRLRVPTVMLLVAQRALQGLDTMPDQFAATRNALDMRQGKAVGHARGVHGLGQGATGQAAFVIEVAEPLGQARSPGEGEQAQGLGVEPGMVCRGVKPADGHGCTFLVVVSRF